MKRRLTSFLIIALVLSLTSMTVFAHAITLKEIEPGVLQAAYDGGGISPRTVITIYDENGEEIASEQVDADGIVDFGDINWAKANAQDGMGHNIDIEKGIEKKEIPKIPVVIGVFVLVGIIIFISQRKKKAE